MVKRKIIYVMGAGRSGTTLLDVALGNQENVISCGELNRFTLRRGIPTEFPEESSRYQFWNYIKEALETNYDLAEYDKLQHDFEHHWGTVKRILGLYNKNRYQRYQRFLKDYYQLIFSRINGTILIDSSKYPGRALSLSETFPEYEISYIYLKRHPIGVVSSFAKKDVCHPPKSWLPANLYYFIVNILCRTALNKLRVSHRVITIRYEEFITDPVESLSRIENALGMPLSTVKKKIISDEKLDVGNLFEGNRIRIPHSIRLKKTLDPYPKSLKNQVTGLLNGWLH